MQGYTYQDLTEVGEEESKRIDFIKEAIERHKATDLYKNAYIADQYKKKRNITISQFQKLLYKVTGEAIVDNFSANYKMASPFYNFFVTQQNQYLLGNGVTWEHQETENKLGNKKYPFDSQLRKLGIYACMGVSYGFFNVDHVEVFSVLEFVPFIDEEDGALKSGIRFWQIDDKKPLRATLYELDGYTEYIWEEGKGRVYKDKRAYILKYRETEIDGVEIYDGQNYPSFPIVPLWGNTDHQSDIVGLREQIDCYDLIKSGFANTVDEASIVYWTLQNAGGMDDLDLQKFINRISAVHAYAGDDAVDIQSHTLEAPYQSRTALLDLLRKDLFDSAMALDPKEIASGAITATQIKASYEPLNTKCDDYEYCIIEFINGILELAGIEDNPTFTRSKIVNTNEEIQILLQCAQYLDREYVTQKILEMFGDGDKAEEMLQKIADNEIEGFNGDGDDSEEEEN